jgi:hypothetical protein
MADQEFTIKVRVPQGTLRKEEPDRTKQHHRITEAVHKALTDKSLGLVSGENVSKLQVECCSDKP